MGVANKRSPCLFPLPFTVTPSLLYQPTSRADNNTTTVQTSSSPFLRVEDPPLSSELRARFLLGAIAGCYTTLTACDPQECLIKDSLFHTLSFSLSSSPRLQWVTTPPLTVLMDWKDMLSYPEIVIILRCVSLLQLLFKSHST